MGLTDKMKGFALNMQEGVKTTSMNIFALSLRIITGLMLGFTLTLIAQEFIGFGQFLLIFGTLVIASLFMKLSSSWRVPHILIFDLICVLVAQLLRMYILLAP